MQRKGFDSKPGAAGINGGGLDERSSELGGSGCCGNIEAGIPPGNTGNTDGT